MRSITGFDPSFVDQKYLNSDKTWTPHEWEMISSKMNFALIDLRSPDDIIDPANTF